MTNEERFNQTVDLANSIGPVSRPVEEIYCIISMEEGYEGLVSWSFSDDPPVNMQCACSDKTLIPTIVQKLKDEAFPKLRPGVKLELRRYVLAENMGEIT